MREENDMNRIMPVFLAVVMLGALCACHREPIIIPDYPSATEQYLFAKKQKETAFLAPSRDTKRKEQITAAIMAFERVIERYPDDLRVTPLAWMDLGDMYLHNKDYKEAVKNYETVLQKYPDQDDAVCKSLYGMGRAYDGLKDYEKALDYYKQCFERFENDKNQLLAMLGRQARQSYGRIRIKK